MSTTRRVPAALPCARRRRRGSRRTHGGLPRGGGEVERAVGSGPSHRQADPEEHEPVLERMRWDPGAAEVAYSRKAKKGQPGAVELLDPLDFLARVIAHVPQPRLHMVRYLGHSSNVSRGRRRKGRDTQLETTSTRDEPDDLTPAERRARRRAWAQLLRRVDEIDPLICEERGGEMRIVSVILDPAVVKTILDHIRKKKDTGTRAPPGPGSSFAAAS